MRGAVIWMPRSPSYAPPHASPHKAELEVFDRGTGGRTWWAHFEFTRINANYPPQKDRGNSGNLTFIVAFIECF
jgi:hypothetical protein